MCVTVHVHLCVRICACMPLVVTAGCRWQHSLPMLFPLRGWRGSCRGRTALLWLSRGSQGKSKPDISPSHGSGCS